jgi:hypothetical protein
VSLTLATLSLVYDEAQATLETADQNLRTIIRLTSSAVGVGGLTVTHRQSLEAMTQRYLAAIDGVDAAYSAYQAAYDLSEGATK